MEKVATRGQILWLKYTKFDFDWGSAPEPAGGAQRSADPLAGFKGPTSKRGEGRGSGRKGRTKGGKKNPPFKMSAYGPAHCHLISYMAYFCIL